MTTGQAGGAEIPSTVQDAAVAIAVCRLPDQTILLANEAALDFYERPREEVVGRRARDFAYNEQEHATDVGMSALASGAVASYRATRRLRRGDGGCVDVSIWVRALSHPPARWAVSIMVPSGRGSAAARAIARHFTPDETDLDVGTTDHAFRIRQVCTNSGSMLGSESRSLIGTRLLDLVHPDDAELLRTGLGRAVRGEDSMVAVRMRHAARGWASVKCLFFQGSDGLGFALAEPTAGAADLREGEARANALESHLMRIWSELHSSGLLSPSSPAPPDRAGALSELSERQREIVERLLRGERVPGIAAEMHLSAATVRNHLTRVFEKYGVHSQAEVIALLRPRPAEPSDE